MNKLILLIGTLLLSNLLYSQQVLPTADYYDLYDLVDPNRQNLNLILGQKEKKYKGTPFLNTEFDLGYVVDTKGTRFTNKFLNFDIHKNDLWYQTGEEVIIIDKDNIKSFGWTYNDKTVVFEKCILNGIPTYMESVYAGNTIQVYKKHNKKYIKRDNGSPVNVHNELVDEYLDAKADYYYMTDDRYLPMSIKSKEFFKVFGKKEVEMQKYAKSNKLKLKNQAHIQIIFAHYESIMNI